MSTLEDRLRAGLHDLADDPSARSTDGRAAQALWSAGRRHHRRQRAGTLTVLVMAVALIVLTLGVAWLRATPQPAPAGTTGAPVLPDHFYEPSPWLPGTGEDPPGRLVATISADRGTWGGMRRGVVGVSAVGSEYRFLDLPDLVLDEEAVLSPDGRSVAFWTLGTPSKAPREEAGEFTSGTITGYAVYDTGTGEVRLQPVPTRFGLGVGSFGGTSLVWADPENLVATYGQLQGGPGSEGQAVTTGIATWVWDPAASVAPRRLDLARDAEIAGSTGAGEVVVGTAPGPGTATRYDLVALDGSRREGPTPGVVTRAPVFDGPGDRFAFFRGEREFGPLRVAEVDSRRTLLPSPVRGVVSVPGWVDRETVVVMRAGGRVPNRLDFVDVTDAQVRRGPLVHQEIRTSLSLATDLLSSRVVTATAPPRPLDPRVVVGQTATILVLAGGALWLWRRRRVHP